VSRNSHLGMSCLVIVATAGLGAAGCVSAPDDPGASSASADGVVYRTIVQFSPDGSIAPIYETVTVAQQQAEQAARAAAIEASRTGAVHPQALPTLKVDGGCAGASLWLFDQANLAGNELCLFKAATDDAAWLDLGTVCRGFLCLGTWSNAVHSLWAGSDPGSLQACTPTLCFATPFVSFTDFQRIDSVVGGAHPLTTAFLFTP